MACSRSSAPYRFLWEVSDTSGNGQDLLDMVSRSYYPLEEDFPHTGRWLPQNIAQPVPNRVNVGNYTKVVKPVPQLYGRNTQMTSKSGYVSLGNYNNLP